MAADITSRTWGESGGTYDIDFDAYISQNILGQLITVYPGEDESAGRLGVLSIRNGSTGTRHVYVIVERCGCVQQFEVSQAVLGHRADPL